MKSISQSRSTESSPQQDSPIIGEGEAKPIVKYSYNKNKAKKPKRNKSAFILFSIETRAKLKSSDVDNVNSNEMMSKLADLWKELPDEERTKFKSKAEKDKRRYHQELETFWKENPNEVIQNKTKKNHVKKPCSAYALYLKEVKAEIKKDNPNLKMADVLRIVSQRWKALQEDDKNKYQESADQEKEKTRMKLEETLSKNDPKSEILLKKKKARQKNEIRKQMKTDGHHEQEPIVSQPLVPNPPIQPLVSQQMMVPLLTTAQSSSLMSKFPLFDGQMSFEKLFSSLLPQPEANKSFSNSMIKNEFVPQVLSYPEAEERVDCELNINPLTLQSSLPKSQELGLSAQKSLIIPTNIFPREQSRESPNLGKTLKKLQDVKVKTSNELVMDLLTFGSNLEKLDSHKQFSIDSLRMESNPFASNIDWTKSNGNANQRPSRQLYTNAIMGALESFGLNNKEKDKESQFFSFFNLPTWTSTNFSKSQAPKSPPGVSQVPGIDNKDDLELKTKQEDDGHSSEVILPTAK